MIYGFLPHVPKLINSQIDMNSFEAWLFQTTKNSSLPTAPSRHIARPSAAWLAGLRDAFDDEAISEEIKTRWEAWASGALITGSGHQV